MSYILHSPNTGDLNRDAAVSILTGGRDGISIDVFPISGRVFEYFGQDIVVSRAGVGMFPFRVKVGDGSRVNLAWETAVDALRFLDGFVLGLDVMADKMKEMQREMRG